MGSTSPVRSISQKPVAGRSASGTSSLAKPTRTVRYGSPGAHGFPTATESLTALLPVLHDLAARYGDRARFYFVPVVFYPEPSYGQVSALYAAADMLDDARLVARGDRLFNAHMAQPALWRDEAGYAELVARLVLVGVAPPGERAQAEPGHAQAGAAQEPLLHGRHGIHSGGRGGVRLAGPVRVRRLCAAPSRRFRRTPCSTSSRQLSSVCSRG